MKLTSNHYYKIADTALKYLLDNRKGTEYPSTKFWIQSFLDTLKKEGYELQVIDASGNIERIELLD
jgi:hypothetical protein